MQSAVWAGCNLGGGGAHGCLWHSPPCFPAALNRACSLSLDRSSSLDGTLQGPGRGTKRYCQDSPPYSAPLSPKLPKNDRHPLEGEHSISSQHCRHRAGNRRGAGGVLLAWELHGEGRSGAQGMEPPQQGKWNIVGVLPSLRAGSQEHYSGAVNPHLGAIAVSLLLMQPHCFSLSASEVCCSVVHGAGCAQVGCAVQPRGWELPFPSCSLQPR